MKCISPIPIKINGKQQLVACGHCPECFELNTKKWALRLKEHAVEQDFIKFVTLTYDEDHVIKNRFGINVVDKDDLQRYLKRLRIDLARSYKSYIKLTYFAVSEYGPKHGRPHYHLLIFGKVPEGLNRESVIHNMDYFIKKNWKRCDLKNINIKDVPMDFKNIGATCMYVSKYLSYGKVYPIVLFNKIQKIIDLYNKKSHLYEHYDYIHKELHKLYGEYRKRYDGSKKFFEYAQNAIYKVICPKPFLICSNGIGLSYFEHIDLQKKLELFAKFENLNIENPFEIFKSIEVYDDIFTEKVAFYDRRNVLHVYSIPLDRYLREKLIEHFNRLSFTIMDCESLYKCIREQFNNIFQEQNNCNTCCNYTMYKHPKYKKYYNNSIF